MFTQWIMVVIDWKNKATIKRKGNWMELVVWSPLQSPSLNFLMVIVAGYGHGDTSSNPGPDWLHFT